MSRAIAVFRADDTLIKIKFQRDRKKYEVPDKVIEYLEKDFKKNTTTKVTKKDLRHMVSAEIIFKYWEKYLKNMHIDQAEAVIKKRINELINETKDVSDYKTQKKYITYNSTNIQERQKVFQNNLDTLIFLEMTSHKNLFYGEGKTNQAEGREFGTIRTNLKKTFHKGIKSKYSIQNLVENTIDTGKDNINRWGMSKEKRTAARIRYKNMSPIAFSVIQGHKNRTKYDRKEELQSQQLKHYSESTAVIHRFNELLEAANNPNFQDINKNSYLHVAVSKGQTKVVKMLLAHEEINIDLKNNDGNTPLHIAAEQGNVELVRLLLEYNASPNIRNNGGYIPWQLTDNEEIENLLDPQEESQQQLFEEDEEISLEGSPRAEMDEEERSKSEEEQDDLYDYFGDPNFLDSQQEKMDEEDSLKGSPYPNGMDEEDIENIHDKKDDMQYSLYDTDMNGACYEYFKDKEDVFYLPAQKEKGHEKAILSNTLDTVIEQLQQGKRVISMVNVDLNHWSTFMICVSDGNLVVYYKDSLGYKPSQVFNTYVSNIAEQMNLDVITRVGRSKEQIENILYEDQDLVHCGVFAVKNAIKLSELSDEEVLQGVKPDYYNPLTENNESVDEENQSDIYDANIKTARHFIADLYHQNDILYNGQFDYESQVSSLDVTYKSYKREESYTSDIELHAAIQNGEYDMVENLLSRGVFDIDEQDDRQNTALHLAVQLASHEKKEEIINLLIAEGADIDIEDANGNTPLHLAAINMDYDTAAILLKKDPASLHAENNNYETALDIAIYNKDIEMAQLIFSQYSDFAQREVKKHNYEYCQLVGDMSEYKSKKRNRDELEEQEDLKSKKNILDEDEKMPKTMPDRKDSIEEDKSEYPQKKFKSANDIGKKPILSLASNLTPEHLADLISKSKNVDQLVRRLNMLEGKDDEYIKKVVDASRNLELPLFKGCTCVQDIISNLEKIPKETKFPSSACQTTGHLMYVLENYQHSKQVPSAFGLRDTVDKIPRQNVFTKNYM
jgi:ankyrin repeat protein